MTTTPLLYDPDCGFCRVCVAVLLTWDRAVELRPVPLGSPEANDLLRGMSEEQQMASWHIVDPRWQENVAENATDPCHPGIRSAGAAFPVLFRLLPGGAPFAVIADKFPGPADKAYRWVADHRSAFGKPIPGGLKRWADRVISESAVDSR